MDLEQHQSLQVAYLQGKQAFERGQYRLSIEQLEIAEKSAAKGTRLQGEVQMWLVTAYQAGGKVPEAIALCKRLTHHPHSELRKKAKHLLYILEAPRLSRPQKWMSEIPELNNVESNIEQYQHGSGKPKPIPAKPKAAIPPPEPEANREADNPFIWFALAVLSLGFLGFAYFIS